MSSQSWTSLPPPTPYQLSGSSPYTSPKHPVSCIEHRLAIRFLPDSIHVSMSFSQIIPPFPSPSPTESKSPFYTSVSLLLSRIFIILLLTFGPCLFNLFQGFFQDRIWAISQDQVKTVLLLESLKSTLWALDFLPPRPQTPTLIYQHEEALNINGAHLSLTFYIYFLGSGMKDSYMAPNSLELKFPSRSSPLFYAKQRTLSPQEKMDIKVDYAQLIAGPASG